MLRAEDRAWAQAWIRTPEQIRKMREEMHAEEQRHGRLFYEKDIDAMDEDEVKVNYMNMVNWLSDVRMGG